jgi:hypothetical protein
MKRVNSACTTAIYLHARCLPRLEIKRKDIRYWGTPVITLQCFNDHVCGKRCDCACHGRQQYLIRDNFLLPVRE